MSVFSFVQQVARYEATYPSHERVFIRATSCTLRGDISISCSCFLDARPIPLMSVLPFRTTRYMKCGEWSFDIVYFR